MHTYPRLPASPKSTDIILYIPTSYGDIFDKINKNEYEALNQLAKVGSAILIIMTMFSVYNYVYV
jgi:hypothetical protein